MELLLAAGAAGLAAYAYGKRRERHQIANGYVTYHHNGYDAPQYGHIHYGNTGNHYRASSHHHHLTAYQNTTYAS
ncbi:unnamed protein product [Rotaria sp. Silwood1]|nr:unnamed protein product [Rotaria sp. Silwood1]CAF1277976.1 unnamed protein product [Rotaria sp. Silwood1]CAF1279817.1 unnamed protein product [Rotaria sp. Silwood1]CAF3496402.1 unnamed protein product [Rotaria sp. Silwood1]CAF3524073.1 unnamed protein product [Rotaria sp. Silwood1]